MPNLEMVLFKVCMSVFVMVLTDDKFGIMGKNFYLDLAADQSEQQGHQGIPRLTEQVANRDLGACVPPKTCNNTGRLIGESIRQILQRL